MGPFPSSFENLYILLVVDYVSKWLKAIACSKNDVNIVVRFIQRNILSIFRAPRTIISDERSHFANKICDGIGLPPSAKWASKNFQ